MKRFATYLLYITGWIGITVMYICSTQMDEPVHLNPLKWYRQHQMAHLEAADEDAPDVPQFALGPRHCHHHHRKNRHFAPVSKSKTTHKETQVRSLMNDLCEAPETDIAVFTSLSSQTYVNYMKNTYSYLFFKEINPPPPKSC